MHQPAPGLSLFWASLPEAHWLISKAIFSPQTPPRKAALMQAQLARSSSQPCCHILPLLGIRTSLPTATKDGSGQWFTQNPAQRKERHMAFCWASLPSRAGWWPCRHHSSPQGEECHCGQGRAASTLPATCTYTMHGVMSDLLLHHRFLRRCY